MNSKKVGWVGADSQKEVVFGSNRSWLNTGVQSERRMIRKLLRNSLTPGVGVETRCQYVNVIDLCNDILEFNVGTQERLNAGEITLRKDQDARWFLQSLHSKHLK
jgi:hypothetical protein